MNPKGCFSDDEILLFLSQLISFFGIKPSFDDSKARKYFKEGKLGPAVYEAQKFMGLDCRLEILKINGDIHKYLVKQPMVSNELREKMSASIRSGNASPMSVIPLAPYVPMYKTEELRRCKFIMPINIKLLTDRPFETFMYLVAHELSHILLESLRHPLRHIEAAVDLTVMLLGFCDIMRIGTCFGDFEYGYLSLHQREVAYCEFKKLL